MCLHNHESEIQMIRIDMTFTVLDTLTSIISDDNTDGPD